MNAPSDAQLLRAYAENHSESAFAELVRRHLDLVYSAAVRMVCDSHLAEDVTQGVFVALAQNAAHLTDRPVLSGWLHRTARNIAAQMVRTDVRRRTREQEAAVMNELPAAGPEVTWKDIAPHLDTALGELNESDRDAVLLRYFEKKSAQEIADLFGISDEAAQKRVGRAVDRLRDFFSRRNITIGASGLAVLFSANAVQSAPVGLAISISAAALAGTAVSGSTAITATKVIAMTALQKTIIGAAFIVALGTGAYEAREAASARAEARTVQQQQALLAEQVSRLQRERDDATNRLAGLIAENGQLESNSNETELLKLRGEIGRLRRMTTPDHMAGVNTESTSPSDATNQVSPEDQFILKRVHAVDTAGALLTAMKAYAAGNNGQYPENLDQLIDSGHFAISNFVGNLGPNDFEIPPPGTTNFQGQKVLLQLRVPIPNPENQSVQVQGAIDGDGRMQTEIFNTSE